MKNSKNTRKIVGSLLLGAAIGGIIGAGLGILFAPEKGIDMRKKLLVKGDNLKGELKDKLNSLVDDIKREVGSAKDKVKETVANGLTRTKKLN